MRSAAVRVAWQIHNNRELGKIRQRGECVVLEGWCCVGVWSEYFIVREASYVENVGSRATDGGSSNARSGVAVTTKHGLLLPRGVRVQLVRRENGVNRLVVKKFSVAIMFDRLSPVVEAALRYRHVNG